MYFLHFAITFAQIKRIGFFCDFKFHLAISQITQITGKTLGNFHAQFWQIGTLFENISKTRSGILQQMFSFYHQKLETLQRKWKLEIHFYLLAKKNIFRKSWSFHDNFIEYRFVSEGVVFWLETSVKDYFEKFQFSFSTIFFRKVTIIVNKENF